MKPPKGIVVTGIVKPPKGIVVTGIVKPPKGIVITGIVKPPKPPIIIPPVVVNPPDVVPLPVPVPGEATYIERRYPWYTGGGMATARPVMNTARPVMNTAEAPCTCLTKEYLEDGSVLFKDVCTKEAAILTIEEMRNKARGANLQNQ